MPAIADFESDPRAPVELRALLTTVIDETAERILRPDVNICCEVEAEVPQAISTGREALHRILTCLTENALQFTTAGTIRARVGAGTELEDGSLQLCFTIQDTGIGIPSDVAWHLRQTVLRNGGAGAAPGPAQGLAICTRLIGQLGGEIGFESVSGNGSTFWFTIFTTRASRLRSLSAAALPDEGPDAAAPGLQVLIVDDNPINQRVLQLLLGRMDLVADIAENGLIAVEKTRARDYDLVVMDLQMPVMDGLEATRMIRRECSGTRQPFITALTANALPEDEKRCRQAGMDAYLPKPLNPQRLTEMVSLVRKRAADRRRLAAAA